jgi:hypothetical protein
MCVIVGGMRHQYSRFVGDKQSIQKAKNGKLGATAAYSRTPVALLTLRYRPVRPTTAQQYVVQIYCT